MIDKHYVVRNYDFKTYKTVAKFSKKWLLIACPEQTGRAAVIMLLTSDAEATENALKRKEPVKTRGRTLRNMQEYNPKITYDVLKRLVDDGLVYRSGNRYAWNTK